MSFHFHDHRRDVADGAHAILSPSKYSWTNYDTKDKLYDMVCSSYAQTIGTLLQDQLYCFGYFLMAYQEES